MESVRIIPDARGSPLPVVCQYGLHLLQPSALTDQGAERLRLYPPHLPPVHQVTMKGMPLVAVSVALYQEGIRTTVGVEQLDEHTLSPPSSRE
jgi:hypothetical protein